MADTSLIDNLTEHLLEHLAPTSEDYCDGECHWDWMTKHALVKARESGAYEQSLSHFLTSDPSRAGRRRGDLVIIVGAAGSGKTTAVHRAIAKAQTHARVCKAATSRSGECSSRFPFLHFDLSHWQPPQANDTLGGEEDKGKFWHRLATALETSTPEPVRVESPSKYWQWLCATPTLLQANEAVERLVTAHYPGVHQLNKEMSGTEEADPKQSQAIANAESMFIQTAPNRDRAWYRLLRLGFAYRLRTPTEPCSCLLVWLDNIDQCDPRLQRLGIEFTLRVTEILQCRGIVTVRPLTWQRTGFGTSIVHVMDHVGPKPASVLRRRVKSFLQQLGPDAALASQAGGLLDALTGHTQDRLVSRVFEWTSGLSIRNAIVNYANALHSELLVGALVSSDGELELRHSDVTRALVFGADDRFNENTFTNLYRVGASDASERQLVKPRIIDLVLRPSAGVLRVRELWMWLARFGYPQELVKMALGELLDEARPLLWFEDGHYVEDLSSRGELRITPLGDSYMSNLYGEYLYEELTLARDIADQISVRAVFDAHRDKAERDLLESKYFIHHHGAILYRHLYPSNVASLGVLHWRHLQRGIRGRVQHADAKDRPALDPKREDFLEHAIRQLLDGMHH